jgi:antitoxin (DNA-binding transcriptional repressor) of toxin-antitoxin stability system
VRDLRYRFSEIERLLEQGEELEITKCKRAIARLLPIRPAPAERSDFMARLRRIYGGRKLKASGAQLLAEERERY